MRDMRADQDDNPFAPPSDDADWGLKATFTGGLDASRGKRFAGAFLDNLVYMAAAFLGGIALGGDVDGLAFLGPLALVGAVQAYLVTTTGQTIGKRMVGSRIVLMDGKAVGFFRGVFVRSWVFQAFLAIPGVGGLLGLVDALFILGESHRCLHDHLAGTRVVDVSRWS